MEPTNGLLKYLSECTSALTVKLYGMLVWGSVATNSDLTRCNDLDLLIVFNDGVNIDIEAIHLVHQLVADIKESFGIVTDPVMCNLSDIRLVIGPALANDLCKTGKNVWGSDLVSKLETVVAGYSKKEFQRRLLKRMVFWRDFVRRKYAVLGWNADFSLEEQRLILKACFFVAKDYLLNETGKIYTRKSEVLDSLDDTVLSDEQKGKLLSLFDSVFAGEKTEWTYVRECVFNLTENLVSIQLKNYCNTYNIELIDLDLVSF